MSTKRILGAGLAILLLILTAVSVSFPQATTARLQGTVTDSSGAAVPGVTVAITNVNTGLESKTVTNQAGLYVAPALPAGSYRVVVSRQGFKTVTQDLTLQIAQVATLDFQLTVGAVTQTVTVQGGAPLIDTANATIGEVITGPQITQLPLNEQNFTTLATLMPGVTRGLPSGQATGANNNAETFRYGQTGGASLAVNGLPPQANNFIYDGIDNNESLVNTIVFFPPYDAIQEFRVITSDASAQYGRAGGGIIIASTKSGTNAFHGDAYYFHRDQSMDSRFFFDTSKAPFARNFFGGSVGGPILKNKLFFFGDYRGLRMNVPQPSGVGTVPTDLMRTGDFSELLCGGNASCPGTGLGAPVQIIDPTTGQQFMGNGSQPNVIPSNRINPVGQNYLKAFPEPNCSPATDSRCGTIINNYVNSRAQIENWDDFDVRADYDLGSKDRFFGRFSRGQANQTSTTFLTTLPSGFGSGQNFNHPNGAALGWTHIFGPNLLSQLNLGYIRTSYGYTPPDEGTPLCTKLGIVNCNTSPLLGGIALIGGYNNQIEYTGDYGPYLVPQTGYEGNGVMTWLHNKQTFTFGAEIIRRQLNLFRPLAGKGYFFLFGNGGGESPTHYEVSDLLAGFVNSYSVGPPFGMVGTRSWENGFFLQDDWTVNRRLSLNLGLRYDVLTWPVEAFDRQSNFDLITGQLLIAGSDGVPRSTIPNDWLNFGPRLGVAWRLTADGKTVLRAGVGVFSYIERGGVSNQLAQNPPFSGEQSFSYDQGYRIALSGQTGAPSNCLPPSSSSCDNNSMDATQPLPLGEFPPTFNLSAPTNVSVISYLPTDSTPRVAEWNVQVQRQLASDMSLSVGYVADHAWHQMDNYNLNVYPFDEAAHSTAPSVPTQLNPCQSALTEPYPCLGSVAVMNTVGTSDFQSLQMQFQRRMTAGWQLLASYTWEKILNDYCDALDSCSPQNPQQLGLERGLSTIDQPYVFVLSSMYQLPFGRGRRWGSSWSRPIDEVLGGWEIDPIYVLTAGLPFDLSVDGSYTGFLRPDLSCVPGTSPGNLLHYINNTCLAAPPATLYPDGSVVANSPGNAGRDILFGPGMSNLDLAISKDFTLMEGKTLQFRVEAYNVTNTPHFGQPNGFVGSYGNTCAVGGATPPCSPTFNPNGSNYQFLGQINSVLPYSNRELELGARFTF
jgi:hypothetical protein